MKIEKGTQLIVRRNLSTMDDSINGILEDMVEHSYRLATIIEYYDDDNFLIDLDDGEWTWERSMFEVAQDEGVLISKERYEELLEFEAMYKDLCN